MTETTERQQIFCEAPDCIAFPDGDERFCREHAAQPSPDAPLPKMLAADAVVTMSGDAPKAVKRYYWDEENNRIHRGPRGKLKSGVWYTIMYLASDYDAVVAERDTLSARASALEAQNAKLREALEKIASESKYQAYDAGKHTDAFMAIRAMARAALSPTPASGTKEET